MTYDKIMEALALLDTEEIVALWNECIEEVNYPHDRVYENDMTFFDEMFSQPYDIAVAVSYGDWKANDKYVVFNGYGNIATFNQWKGYNSPIDIDVLVEWLLDNKAKREELWPCDED